MEATDELMAAGISLADVAAACGVAHETIRRARLDPNSSSYRSPPTGWREKVVALARERGGRLLELAERLEGE